MHVHVHVHVAGMAADSLDVGEDPTKAEVPPGTRTGPVACSLRGLRSVAVHMAVVVVFCVPAIVLWRNAWSDGAASTIRCACLDPGQQV